MLDLLCSTTSVVEMLRASYLRANRCRFHTISGQNDDLRSEPQVTTQGRYHAPGYIRKQTLKLHLLVPTYVGKILSRSESAFIDATREFEGSAAFIDATRRFEGRQDTASC